MIYSLLYFYFRFTTTINKFHFSLEICRFNNLSNWIKYFQLNYTIDPRVFRHINNMTRWTLSIPFIFLKHFWTVFFIKFNLSHWYNIMLIVFYDITVGQVCFHIQEHFEHCQKFTFANMFFCVIFHPLLQ